MSRVLHEDEMTSTSNADSRHRVHFYDDGGMLAHRIAAFLRDALTSGGAAIAVARNDLRVAIERELAGACDLGKLVEERRLVLADADAFLATFMVGDRPDRERFRASVL